MSLSFEKDFNFKSKIISLIYCIGELNVVIMKPSAYYIIESDKSIREMKEYENIEERNGCLYLIHFNGKDILGNIVSYTNMVPNKIEVPKVGYIGWSYIHKHGYNRKNRKHRYKLICFIDTFDQWIPISPIKIYKFLKNRKDCD